MLWRERIRGPIPTRLFDPGPMQLTGFNMTGCEHVLILSALWQLDDRIERGQLVEVYSTESGLRTGYWLGVQRGPLGGMDIVIITTPNASPGVTMHFGPGNVREVTVLQGPSPALWDDDFEAIEEAKYIAEFEEATAVAA